MPDFVEHDGKRIELPKEVEVDLEARAAFIKKVTPAAPAKGKE